MAPRAGLSGGAQQTRSRPLLVKFWLVWNWPAPTQRTCEQDGRLWAPSTWEGFRQVTTLPGNLSIRSARFRIPARTRTTIIAKEDEPVLPCHKALGPEFSRS